MTEEDALDQYARLELLDQVLAKLPEERRAVFILFELEEVSLQDIAERLSIPIGTVASRPAQEHATSSRASSSGCE